MAPPKKAIWQNFSEVIVDGVKRAKCRKCEESVVNNPSRMEKHALKCNAEENKNEPPAKQLKQSTLSVIGTSASKQHAIDLQIARFILATNSSFLTVENQHFQQLVQMLRPGTTVPNRKKVSGELLDEIFQTERNKVKTFIQGAIATLAIDGWSTLTNEPVIGICFMSGNECYLANTVNTTGEHHTGDYLLELAKHQIAYVEEEYEVKIRSLVTDNAANMVSMRKQIPELHTYGCHAHIANLLSKDILNHKDFKPVLAKVLTVIKFVRNTHDCSTALKENQMPRPPMPVETRWNSNIDVLCYFVNNWAKLADIINSNARSSENVYRYMEEISLKRAVEDALNFLKPIGVLLDKLQDDTTKLADTFDLWKAVLEDVPVEYSLLIAKRVEMALTSVVYAANLLDHRYNGKTLSPLETATAVEYLKEMFGEAILPELTKYMGQVAPY